MTNKMDINNLRTFVEALNKLPDEVKNNKVDMDSGAEPVCGTAGCHAGLISIVAEYIPKLKCSYGEYPEYNFVRWADALAEFLGFDDEMCLRDWADDNPKLWGNPCGYSMFGDELAFEEETNIFPHSVIIDRWTAVLKRVEQSNNKGEI